MTRGHRATLRTISEMTGLSLSTVSLSLRGGGNLKAETRAKIADAARAVGYVPDRAGVRLRTGKTNVIALVLDGAESALGFSRQMIQGIGDAIRDSRYHLTVMPEFDRIASVDTIRYILDNRTADGVILTHTAPRDPRVALLMEADFPFVTHGRTEFFTPHPFHDFDAEAYVNLAVNRLVDRGARRLMSVVWDDQTFNFHTIRNSFLAAVARAGVEGRISVQSADAAGRTQTMRAFGEALARDPARPDGILCDVQAGIRTFHSSPALQAALSRNLAHLDHEFRRKGTDDAHSLRLAWPRPDDGADRAALADAELLLVRGDAA